MNLTRAQKIRLGAFMLTGTLLFTGAIAALAGLQVWEKRAVFKVRFAEEISGLEVSAPVKYQGLRIGRVEDMVIAPDDPTAIEVTLGLDPRTVLYEGTEAVLDRSGLTGLKTINLTPGDATKSRLVPGSTIPAGQSFVDRITGRAEAIALKMELITDQLADWTKPANRARVERLLENTTTLAKEVEGFLATNREPTRAALQGVAQASATVAGLGGEGAQSLKVVRDEAVKTFEEARTTLRELRRPLSQVDPKEVAQVVSSTERAMRSLDNRLSSKEIGQAIDQLISTLEQVTQLLQSVDLAVRAGRDDFVSTLSDLRQAAEDVREFSRIIAQDPSALIRGKE